MQNVIYMYYKEIILPLEEEVKALEIKTKKSIISKILYHKELDKCKRILYKHYIEFAKVIEEYDF